MEAVNSLEPEKHASQKDLFGVRLDLSEMRGEVRLTNEKYSSLKETMSSVALTLHSINEKMATKEDLKEKDSKIQELQTKIDENNLKSETKLGQISDSFSLKIGEVLLKFDAMSGKAGDELVKTSKSIGKFDIISAIVMVIVSGIIGIVLGKVI